MKTNVKGIKILARLNKKIVVDELKRYGHSTVDEDILRVELDDESKLFEILDIIEAHEVKDELGILIIKTYEIEHEPDWYPFEPMFQTEEFYLNSTSFYIDKKKATYGLELEYDFEKLWTVDIRRFLYKEDVASFIEDTSCILNDLLKSMEEQEVNE